MIRRRPRINSVYVLIGLLFAAACGLGIAAQKGGENVVNAPRARFNDASPLGGKGFQLLLRRLGYQVHLQDEALTTMPNDARVWILLDPETRFSRRETDLLLSWVRSGGTLIWACAPATSSFAWNSGSDQTAHSLLCQKLGVTSSYAFTPNDAPLPVLTPLTPSSANEYWNGVTKATASADLIRIDRPNLELASTPAGTELARIAVGNGQVFVMADALMWTNYALDKPDNAVLATNLIRLHAMNGGVYFDERDHPNNDAAASANGQSAPDLTDYLWRPPIRWAVLQLLGALLLWWALAGRRLGAPVPLMEQEPVTRAGQFAQAMGSLFRKANRPAAVAQTLGNSFRRETTARVGLPLDASDDLIAERVAQSTGLPAPMIDRLLLRAKAPAPTETEILSDVQEMEIVLRALRGDHS
jgi:hypothetical protein